MASKIPRRSSYSSSKIPKPHTVTRSPPAPVIPQPAVKVSRIPHYSSPTKEIPSLSKTPDHSAQDDTCTNGTSSTVESHSNVSEEHQCDIEPLSHSDRSTPVKNKNEQTSPKHVGSSPENNVEKRDIEENKTAECASTVSPSRLPTPSKLPVSSHSSSPHSRLPTAIGKHHDSRGGSTKVGSIGVKSASASALPSSGESRIPIPGSRHTPEKKLSTSRSIPDTATESKIPVSRSASAPDHDIVVPSGGQRFETFLMTGEMMIRTSDPHYKSDKVNKALVVNEQNNVNEQPEVDKENTTNEDDSVDDIDFDQDIVLKINEENESDEKSDTEKTNILSEDELNEDNLDVHEVDEIINTCERSPDEQLHYSPVIDCVELNDLVCEEPSVQHAQHSVSSQSCSDGNITEEDLSGKSSEQSPARIMVTSQSDEKMFKTSSVPKSHEPLRGSKSQDNYLENDTFHMVDIDFDDTHAASYNALHYDSDLSSPTSSNDHVRSADSSPMRNPHDYSVTGSIESSPEPTNRLSRQAFLPGFIHLESERETTPESSIPSEECYEDNVETVLERELEEKVVAELSDIEMSQVSGNGRKSSHSLSSPDSEDSDQESLYFHPPKEVDKPSARRLAKRLYYLEGFGKSDVCKHLSKNNDFTQYVAEEYLGFFEFNSKTLDEALRQFLSQFSLSGETQERERVLAHFSSRYMKCNPGSFNSDDACHTLTCAIMLLNTDLHGQNIGRKMTSAEFVENLSELNDGENFSRDVLKTIYTHIKSEAIDWAMDETPPSDPIVVQSMRPDDLIQLVGANPFLEIPDASNTTEYKKGYVMRKCVLDIDGRRTALGKRSWKMFFMCLRDMVLFLYKDEQSYKKNQFHSIHNTIRVHHSIATHAPDYKKKQNVFRLKTADWAEYLFQTSDPKDCTEWTDSINGIAASLSAPPLAAAVGSQKKFQRPLMPSSYTKLNLREQLNHHDCRILELEQDLLDHQQYPPEKGAKARFIAEYTERENYLKFELQRFRTYSHLIVAKMSAYPELEPTLVETAIGEVDEPPSSPDSTKSGDFDVHLRQLPTTSKAVQRSHSDSEDSCDSYINSETLVTEL